MKENICISPHNIISMLHMLYFATTGPTHEQIKISLGLQDVDDVEKYFKSQLQLYPEAFDTANKLFTNHKFNVNQDCGALLKSTFNADTEPIDFSNDTAANTINGWVSSATKNKINDVVKPESLNSLTDVVFISVINLKCDWDSAFDAGLTETGKFEGEDVDFMRDERYLWCSSTDQADIVELPLKSENLRMLFVMPKITSENALSTFSNINELMNTLTFENVDLSVPKFDINYKKSLVGPLTEVTQFEIRSL